MLSRLAQGVNSVIQELSGEESHEGGSLSQDVGAPEDPAEAAAVGEEDTLERLAHTEQLVVQLKEMIRERDGQLASTQRQLKEEKEAGDVRLTKLKLQAKARMAALNKQIAELKGQEGGSSTQSPDSSFTMVPGMEEELQQLKHRLQEEESVSRTLREQLEVSEQCLREKEGHVEQVRVLQAVVCEKDVRFQEQIQKHEEELLNITTQAKDNTELQQALGAAQRRVEELEEMVHSRSQVLEMLQQELNDADQQKQILTSQFRQMEQELAEARRQMEDQLAESRRQAEEVLTESRRQAGEELTESRRQMEQELVEARRQVEEERQQWFQEASSAKAELAILRERLEAAVSDNEEALKEKSEAEAGMEAELAALRERLQAVSDNEEALKEKNEAEAGMEAELAALRERLQAVSDNEEALREKSEAEARMEAELAALRERLQAVSDNEEVLREKSEVEAGMEAELAALRERLEAADREKEEAVARLEIEAGERVAEIAALRKRLQVTETEGNDREWREGEVVARMEAELIALRGRLEAVEREREEGAQSEGETMARMEAELAALRDRLETEGERQQVAETMAELWKGLRALAGGEAEPQGEGEELPVLSDPTLCMEALRTLEKRLNSLRGEWHGSEERCSQISLAMEALQGELDKSVAEGEESVARIQQLELQISSLKIAGGSQAVAVTDPLLEGPMAAEGGMARPALDNQAHMEKDMGGEHDSNSAQLLDNSQMMALEQQLLEKEQELAALRTRLAFTEEQSCSSKSSPEGSTEHGQEGTTGKLGEVSVLIDIPEDTETEEVALVAEDSSFLSAAGDKEGSPELIGLQPESPEDGETKGAPSDEMVTSSDSDAAPSSWTLLEAVNQEGGQEWPSLMQDFGQLHLQSWEEAGDEQSASTICSVQADSSSVIIRESVEVHITQQGAILQGVDSGSGQAFAQLLAEELQRRYSELLAELQSLREGASRSQRRTEELEEELMELQAAKDLAESLALEREEALNAATRELQEEAQRRSSVIECQSTEGKVLEEQLASLRMEACSKDQKLQALEVDLEKAQHCLLEKEGQARMLSAMLEEKELVSVGLEHKLSDAELRLQEASQANATAEVVLSERSAEIQELQLHLSQKAQQLEELSMVMSDKLHQAGEEKLVISSEVKKLKEQMVDLEKVWEEQQKEKGSPTEEVEEVVSLRRANEELSAKLATIKKDGDLMKRKLQAALVQRKELLRKVEAFEQEAEKRKEYGETEEKSITEVPEPEHEMEKERMKKDILQLEAALEEARQTLRTKENVFETMELRMAQQDQALAEALAVNQKLNEELENNPSQIPDVEQAQREVDERAALQSQLASLKTEYETLQKKLQEALENRKDTIRKAKEKDRHFREQLKQQKEEHNGLLERFDEQTRERDRLLEQLNELEQLKAQKEVKAHSTKTEAEEEEEKEKADAPNLEKLERPGGDWGQEDWVDFSATEPDTEPLPEKDNAILSVEQTPPLLPTAPADGSALKALQKEIEVEQASRQELERQLEESQACLSLKETELLDMRKELQELREKERQIDVLSGEMEALREKWQQAQSQTEALRAEIEAQESNTGPDSPVSLLQAEVQEFKQFLSSKNEEITELSCQLSEQNSLLLAVQETVSEKDHLIASLQEDLKAEQEKTQRLEAEVPQQQEEENAANTAKFQQLQRKLQAALISRKDVLKESKTLKEELVSAQAVMAELRQRLEAGEAELEKLRGEREKLIEEVDRALLENESLGASCESFKLAMEGVLKEKEVREREASYSKEQAAQTCQEWEEKVQGMKEEYETLLKSYENVSDEAERVRRVLEAARQERQELMTRARAHEAARQQAERQAEEAQREVETVKEKMRKFAKTKQQKIMDLEEENERLREAEERKGDGAERREHRRQKEELVRVKEELEMLKADLEVVRDQKDLLEQEATELREQLAQELEKANTQPQDTSPSPVAIVEEAVIAQQSSLVLTQTNQELNENREDPEKANLMEMPAEVAPEPNSVEDAPEMGPSKHTLEQAQDKVREAEAALHAEKESRQERELELTASLSSLEQRLRAAEEREEKLHSDRESRQEWEAELTASLSTLEQQLKVAEEREENLREEAIRKGVQLEEVQARLEAEKDDLEERLMNQLAQLNGSIAGYQQEAADSRERLTELQREVERLERERAELEAVAESEKDRSARLEEDKRQAQRERAEAEAETGKQRELEQKLKSAQRGKEGSQSRARQLEELLREKQLEVRQMQRDCIQYQERISELDKEAKALQLGKKEACCELEAARQETTKTSEKMKRVEEELSLCKVSLEETQRELGHARGEQRASEEKALQHEAQSKVEAEQTLDEVRLRLGAELKQAELRLEDAYREVEREEVATEEARQLAVVREKQAQEMQCQLDESLARLAAFSRSMSSLQDDRDRVLDEARQWESRFHSTLQGKEADVREAEMRVRDLTEQLQKETAQKAELQLALARLQKAEEEWQHKWEEEGKRHRESQAALEKERGELKEALTQAESSLAQTRAQLATLETEAEGLRHRAQALDEAVGELQRGAEKARAELRDREAEERRLGLCLEQLETDLRSSKALTEALQTELGEKERREMELLGEKEQAVTQAAEEARREADGRAREAEKEVEERREEVRGLEDRVRKAVEESSHSKARLDAFTKAMGSLQDDRDRVLTQYKQLEERHLQVMMEKDALIQEAAGENNSLKEELRGLLVQRDDLNAEKAKLSAQLHGYRDDLTQVLSMKDSQHKQLLAGQTQRIVALEQEKQLMETELRSLQREREEAGGREVAVERVTLSRAAGDGARAEVEELREQLQAALDQVASLEGDFHSMREAEDARVKELSELRWEGGVLRTETETAEERVAELARDLVELEQKLLTEREEAAQIREQNKSFGQAMASLQDSRDQAINEVEELRLRLEEMSRMGTQPASPSPPAGSTGEVWALKNALSALQNDRERLLEQLRIQRSELSRVGQGGEELARVALELEEERRKAKEREERLENDRQELETLRQQRVDWQAQAELLKQQTLATLTDRDQQVQQLSAMLEEARALSPKVQAEQYQREAPLGTDLSAEHQVLQAESGQLSGQLSSQQDNPLKELELKELKIIDLSSKLSQVSEEKHSLAAQLVSRSQRLDEAQSRCSALQRQLQEMQEDKTKGSPEMDSAPGAPQERSSSTESEGYRSEFKELQRRLDEELEHRQAMEEQLLATQDRLKRHAQGMWQSEEGNFSETAVLIEPPEGTVTRSRNTGPGLGRMLRAAFCSRQRTPLLASLYLLTVHVLLLLCLGGYL
ncbi:golgin subfamily B member 1 isoform X2 [Conger conger]|uniref:golgin subfamily B member 1 isoform X2 n=1 Tax=Conger conger TaxID=82655 RepID=UPI002A59EFA0|nr:golgin subfamily B member 1 isoform X2 [Conger conger]